MQQISKFLSFSGLALACASAVAAMAATAALPIAAAEAATVGKIFVVVAAASVP